MNIALHCKVTAVITGHSVLEVETWNTTLLPVSTTSANISNLLTGSDCTIVLENVLGVRDVLSVEIGLSKIITITISPNKDNQLDSVYNYHISCGGISHQTTSPSTTLYIEDRSISMSSHRI